MPKPVRRSNSQSPNSNVHRFVSYSEHDPHRLVAIDPNEKARRAGVRAYIEGLIRARGWNLTVVATRTGLNHSYISRIASGHRTPSLLTAMLLSAVFDRPLQEMADRLVGTYTPTPEVTDGTGTA